MTEGPRSISDGRRITAWMALALLALATTTLSVLAVTEILERCGRPAVPLDDAYIHFQYARSFAELHPFAYTKGATPTPGATSLLWPALLAPFHAAGLRGALLAWAAWSLGFLALAGTAYETSRLAERLVSRGTALLSGAMCLAFGGFVWFAASGMEVMPFAWILTRSARKAAEWHEGEEVRVAELHGLSILAPLMRPEGALSSLMIAGALLVRPRGSRLHAVPALLGPLAPSLACWVFTGQAMQSTALAKWLPLNPYYPTARLASAIEHNLGVFFGTLLDGRLWTSVFLPQGGKFAAMLSLVAVVVVGARQRRLPRGILVLLLALGALIPTTYETFLVNRVRYIWPFFTGWFVALAALAEILGEVAAYPFSRWGARAAHGGAAVAAAFTALLASKLSWTLEDLSESAHAITLQQVSLAEWAKAELPETAKLGVNDTGALAYFSGRATFDIVGLTTAGEARYWAAGAGSRFEHYEHLQPSALPTHFIVYPEWFGTDPLLGQELTYRSVRHTILGGVTMSAFTARYDLLRSGDTPTAIDLGERRVVDSLDVADLDSELAHHYELDDATKDGNIVVSDMLTADGGRRDRAQDRFSMTLAPGGTLVARFWSEKPGTALLRIDDHDVQTLTIAPGAFQETRVQVPSSVGRGEHVVSIDARGARFCSLHYWSYE